MIVKPFLLPRILMVLFLGGHQVLASAAVTSEPVGIPAPAAIEDGKKVPEATKPEPAATPAPAAIEDTKKADAPTPKEKTKSKKAKPSDAEIEVKKAERAVAKAKDAAVLPLATDKEKAEAEHVLKVKEAELAVAQAKKALAEAKEEDKKVAQEKLTAAEKALAETKAPVSPETKPDTKPEAKDVATEKPADAEKKDPEDNKDIKEAARNMRNAQFLLVRAIRTELNAKRLYEVTLRQTETSKETCLRVYKELGGLTKSLEKRFTAAKIALTEMEEKLKGYAEAKAPNEKAKDFSKAQVDLAKVRIGRVSKDRAAAYRSLKIASKCAKFYMQRDAIKEGEEDENDQNDDLDDEARQAKQELEDDEGGLQGAGEETAEAGAYVNTAVQQGDDDGSGDLLPAFDPGMGQPDMGQGFNGQCDPNTDPNQCQGMNQEMNMGQCDPNTDPNGCAGMNQNVGFNGGFNGQCDPNTDPNQCQGNQGMNQAQCDPNTDPNQCQGNQVMNPGQCDPNTDPNQCQGNQGMSQGMAQGNRSGPADATPLPTPEPEDPKPPVVHEETENLAAEEAAASTEEEVKEAAKPEFEKEHDLAEVPQEESKEPAPEPEPALTEGFGEEDKGPHDKDAERKALEEANLEVEKAEVKVAAARESGDELETVNAEMDLEDAQVELSKKQIQQAPYGKKLDIRDSRSWETGGGRDFFNQEAADQGGVFNPRISTSESVSDLVMADSKLNESGGYVVEQPRILVLERPGSSVSTTEQLNRDRPSFTSDSGMQGL